MCWIKNPFIHTQHYKPQTIKQQHVRKRNYNQAQASRRDQEEPHRQWRN